MPGIVGHRKEGRKGGREGGRKEGRTEGGEVKGRKGKKGH